MLGLGFSIPEVAVRRGGAFVGPGPEMIINGGFDTDTGWTHGANPAISGGVATWNANGNLSQSQTFVQGGVYRVTLSVTAYTSGSFRPAFTGGTSVFGTPAATAAGPFQWDMTALAGNNTFQVQGVSTSVGAIDNVSMVRIA